MSGTQIFVGVWAIVSVVVCAWAVWRVATTPKLSYKPLWIIGSLVGFVGFATSFGAPGDLHMEVGLQIPVLVIWTVSGGIALKAMFPVVAVVALAVIDARDTPSAE